MPASRSLRDLDCPTRMFLASLCLTDGDLATFGLLARHGSPDLACTTRARAVLHRLLGTDPEVARAVADLLDLRHLDIVLRVRDLAAAGVAPFGSLGHVLEKGHDVAGVAWALATDPRGDVTPVARRLMGECYVKGMRLTCEHTPPAVNRPGRDLQ